MKEIIIDVSAEGQIRVETRGFSGKSCIAESQFLKDVLGKETYTQLTPTYYQKTIQTAKKYLPLCG